VATGYSCKGNQSIHLFAIRLPSDEDATAEHRGKRNSGRKKRIECGRRAVLRSCSSVSSAHRPRETEPPFRLRTISRSGDSGCSKRNTFLPERGPNGSAARNPTRSRQVPNGKERLSSCYPNHEWSNEASHGPHVSGPSHQTVNGSTLPQRTSLRRIRHPHERKTRENRTYNFITASRHAGGRVRSVSVRRQDSWRLAPRRMAISRAECTSVAETFSTIRIFRRTQTPRPSGET